MLRVSQTAAHTYTYRSMVVAYIIVLGASAMLLALIDSLNWYSFAVFAVGLIVVPAMLHGFQDRCEYHASNVPSTAPKVVTASSSPTLMAVNTTLTAPRAKEPNPDYAKTVVVSAPTMGLNPKTGKFDYPVMQSLKRDMHARKITLGYSFAGDSIPYQDTQVLQKQYANAPADEKAMRLQQLKAVVQNGPWWKVYMGQVMGAVKSLCMQGNAVTMVGIQGGPITQLEQAEMAKVRINIIADLQSSHKGLEPDIELDLGLATYERFAEKYL